MADPNTDNPITLFLDTNSLLHYPPIRSVKWSAVANSNKVRLLLCLQVIHELDEKKDDSRLGNRAKRVIKEVRELRQADAESGFTLEVFNYEVKSADFPESLSIDSKDDRIVLSALKYSEQHPSERIAVYTEDMGMMLRCEANGVEVVEPDAGQRLESPQDELEKKYRTAITELNELKKRLPKLRLCVTEVNGDPHSGGAFSCKMLDNWSPIDVEARLKEHKRRFPKMQPPATGSDSMIPGNLLGYGVSKSDTDKYNTQLENYFLNYQFYLQRLNTWGSNDARSFNFDLWLKNEGSCPADDIDVSLHFPVVVRWLADVNSESAGSLVQPQSPTPPEKPKPELFSHSLRDFTMPQITPIPQQFERMLSERESDKIEVLRCQDASHLIQAKIKRVKHGQARRFGRFTGVLANWDDVRPFQAEWSISASELPDTQRGQIPILLRKSGEADCNDQPNHN